MRISEFENYITALFGKDKLDIANEGEFGFTVKCKDEFKKIGYATNLTPDVASLAIEKGVDLLVTHHNAWENIYYDISKQVYKMLEEKGISHFYIHLPLDDAEFGTNASLMDKVGAKIIERTHLEEGYLCGRVGELEKEVSFDEFVKRVEGILQEPVRAWKFNDRPVKRVGVVTGGGSMSTDVKEAADKNCDVYITGEKSMFTIHYAKYSGMNLIVGSHTFTEIFGVESLVDKIKEKFNHLELVKLVEEHIE